MKTLTNNMRELGRFITKAHKPKPPLTVSQWAEQHIHIPASQGTAIPGRLNLDHTPYLRGMLDAIDTTPRSTWMTAAGVGKTLGLVCGIAYYIVQKPRRQLLGRDTKANVLKWNRADWLPIVRASPELARRLPKGKRFMQTLQEFPGAPLGLTGMKTAGNLAGDTVHNVWKDEYEKNYGGADAGREASPNELIRHRCARSDEPHEVGASTPATMLGDVYRDYCAGTQERYHVPCPHCSEFIELLWEQITFDFCKDESGNWDQARVQKEAYYKCQKCGGKIEDKHKADMLIKGTWVETPFAERLFVGEDGPQKPELGHRSFHVANWYAPWSQNTWGNVALRWINGAASGLWSQVQNFMNSIRGLPYDDTPEFRAGAPDELITADYERGVLGIVKFPEIKDKHGKVVQAAREVDLSKSTRLMAVDVQSYGFKWSVIAAVKGELFWIDHGLVPDFGALDRIKASYGCEYAICDVQSELEGKQAVKEAVFAREARGWFASEMQAEQDALVDLKGIDPYKGSSLQGRYKMRTLWGDGYTLKMECDHKRAGNGLFKLWIYRVDRKGADKDDDRQTLITELWSEKRIPKKKAKAGSRHTHEYKKTNVNNHMWDCLVMTLMLERFLDRSWRLMSKAGKPASSGARVAGSIKHS